MIKLSELKRDVIVIDENSSIYTVKEVRDNFKDFNHKKLYTTIEYHAFIDAKDILNTAIEQEYCSNMYEDWDEHILNDITDEDIQKIQVVLDNILDRAKEQNIAYQQDEEINIFK